MSILDAIIQGVVQGLTEFLPVSSSGHLAITQHILGAGTGESNLFFNVMLHVGTLVAVVAFYHKLVWDLIKEFFLMLKDISYTAVLAFSADSRNRYETQGPCRPAFRKSCSHSNCLFAHSHKRTFNNRYYL